MILKREKIWVIFLVAIFPFISVSLALGQEKFPSRPVQFIIPWAAGGGGTINAQMLQPQFEKK